MLLLFKIANLYSIDRFRLTASFFEQAESDSLTIFLSQFYAVNEPQDQRGLLDIG